MIEAHYTNGSKSRAPQLAFARSENGYRVWISRTTVAGKADARKLAAEMGAKPWNF